MSALPMEACQRCGSAWTVHVENAYLCGYYCPACDIPVGKRFEWNRACPHAGIHGTYDKILTRKLRYA